MRPRHIHLERDRALHLEWDDGSRTSISIACLRRHSPSADAKSLREAMALNPLTVLPSTRATGPLTATSCEPVGGYAVRIAFSDGHSTGIYSWDYLRELAALDASGGS